MKEIKNVLKIFISSTKAWVNDLMQKIEYLYNFSQIMVFRLFVSKIGHRLLEHFKYNVHFWSSKNCWVFWRNLRRVRRNKKLWRNFLMKNNCFIKAEKSRGFHLNWKPIVHESAFKSDFNLLIRQLRQKNS